MHNLNTTLFLSIYHFAGHSALLDALAVAVTRYLTPLVIIAALWWCCVWIPWHTKGYRSYVQHLREGAELLLSLLLSWGIVSLLKMLVLHPRPFTTLEGVVPLVTALPLHSFPSAHAALTAATAAVVSRTHPWLGGALGIFALLVGLSRLYVGVHYPVDVLAGFIIGWAVVAIVHHLLLDKSHI